MRESENKKRMDKQLWRKRGENKIEKTKLEKRGKGRMGIRKKTVKKARGGKEIVWKWKRDDGRKAEMEIEKRGEKIEKRQKKERQKKRKKREKRE